MRKDRSSVYRQHTRLASSRGEVLDNVGVGLAVLVHGLAHAEQEAAAEERRKRRRPPSGEGRSMIRWQSWGEGNLRIDDVDVLWRLSPDDSRKEELSEDSACRYM
jgi:hypothetical protein